MENKKIKGSGGKILVGALTLAAFFLILCSSDVAIEYMKKGLVLCSSTVIPSLFPFMVISELIVSSGIGISISRILRRPMRKLFGVSEAGAAAFLLGTVCGFPIGAATAASMQDKGIISKSELEHILIFCNNPGSAFVISAVGASLFGNKSLGLLLYTSVILSSVIIGIAGRLLLPKCNTDAATVTLTAPSQSFTSRLTDAIRSSAISMLTVCAYILFFSAFVGCIGDLLERFALSEEIRAVVFGLFELSSGVKAASTTQEPVVAVVLSALFLGWSGMSVHMQIMSVCSGRGISFKPYFIAKVAQGLISATLTYCAIRLFFPELASFPLGTFAPSYNPLFGGICAISTAFFIACAIFSMFDWLCKRKNKK